ncbi:MAG: DUF4392 domain-containing protein [Phycisphaerales bacterium]|nr:DUF4392 domain-containing protein [Phycisphaerales bacterium]
MSELVAEFERFIRRDPAGRGLISTEPERGPLCPGHLNRAAEHLARHGTSIGIVTGFYIPHSKPPAAETDGPLGAALLAATLHELGMECWLITDEPCAPAVKAAASAMVLPAGTTLVAPARCDDWIREFYRAGPGHRLSHLIAVERVGPSHTLESMEAQKRADLPPRNDFNARVPEASRDRCHNMRARVIDEWTGDLHRLFELAGAAGHPVSTIGIGDGGNEIGMGVVPWEELAARLNREGDALVPCRIATDWTIVAGTSNWGAEALAASVCVHRRQFDPLRPWTIARMEAALERIVSEGPAVDGITGLREATVDGLPFITYVQPWLSIRQRLGLPAED